MFGYITESQARAAGFTHHCTYYGIPHWIELTEETFDCPRIVPKWGPLEWFVLPLLRHSEGFLHSVLWPEEEPGFEFVIGKEIDS